MAGHLFRLWMRYLAAAVGLFDLVGRETMRTRRIVSSSWLSEGFDGNDWEDVHRDLS